MTSTEAQAQMDLTALAERVEKLGEPDRSVDEAIFEIINGRKRRISTFEQYEPSETLPAYTASLDAAMTLLENRIRGFTLTMRSNPDMGGRDYIASTIGRRAAGRSFPLAIVALALRARSHKDTPHD